MSRELLSIVIPVYNEADNLTDLYRQLIGALGALDYAFEIIFVNDGSQDKTTEVLDELGKSDARVKVIEFTRNFGKEIALTAGLEHCRGAACITIDADLQHPPALIPFFIAKWQAGSEVVVGVRKNRAGDGLIKRLGAWLFYKVINIIAETKVEMNATDYRLIDRQVIDVYKKLTERNRLHRALIDWLGFKKDYVYFHMVKRANGKPGYGFFKLSRLALNGFVGYSLFPLRLAGYLGVIITLLSGGLGVFILLEKYLFNDPWNLRFSGPAILAVINLFLVGVILVCLGLIALYIANIHREVVNRPLYIKREVKHD